MLRRLKKRPNNDLIGVEKKSSKRARLARRAKAAFPAFLRRVLPALSGDPQKNHETYGRLPRAQKAIVIMSSDSPQAVSEFHAGDVDKMLVCEAQGLPEGVFISPHKTTYQHVSSAPKPPGVDESPHRLYVSRTHRENFTVARDPSVILSLAHFRAIFPKLSLPSNTFKEIEITLTPMLLREMEALDRRDTKKYLPNKKIMQRVSAGDIAVACGYPDRKRRIRHSSARKKYRLSDWEYSHLLAFSLGGATLGAGNLVVTSYPCNSQMMAVETYVKHLLHMGEPRVTVHVRAELHPHSHMATDLTYTVTTHKGSEIFHYDPLSFVVPDARQANYFYENYQVTRTPGTPKTQSKNKAVSGADLREVKAALFFGAISSSDTTNTVSSGSESMSESDELSDTLESPPPPIAEQTAAAIVMDVDINQANDQQDSRGAVSPLCLSLRR